MSAYWLVARPHRRAVVRREFHHLAEVPAPRWGHRIAMEEVPGTNERRNPTFAGGTGGIISHLDARAADQDPVDRRGDTRTNLKAEYASAATPGTIIKMLRAARVRAPNRSLVTASVCPPPDGSKPVWS